MAIAYFPKIGEVHFERVVTFLRSDGWSCQPQGKSLEFWSKGDLCFRLPELGAFALFGDSPSAVGSALIAIGADHGWSAFEVWNQVIEERSSMEGKQDALRELWSVKSKDCWWTLYVHLHRRVNALCQGTPDHMLSPKALVVIAARDLVDAVCVGGEMYSFASVCDMLGLVGEYEALSLLRDYDSPSVLANKVCGEVGKLFRALVEDKESGSIRITTHPAHFNPLYQHDLRSAFLGDGLILEDVTRDGELSVFALRRTS